MAGEAATVERTFSFVDLAGFTALTEAHGDADAVALLDDFLTMTREALDTGDELVKSIGDAVMLASRAPEPAVRAVGRLMASCQETTGFPLPRAGAHHGPAISRDGDYLGGAVNLAARVAGHASGGQFLVTAPVADAARVVALEVVALGAHQLRNVAEPVELFDVRVSSGETSHTIDPVCRMHLDREHAAGSLCHEGRHYWFCSLDCVSVFAAKPDRYTVPDMAE
ncbi:MAG: YHS domain-containing protein [Acidimicrobiales bacterium]